ncbi:MAG TPA: hypothetical protein VIG06_15685 [Kofleriaceae bacterium]|jgi:hypothetical protein
MMKRRRAIALAGLLVGAAAAPARAQDFPADPDWEEFHCGDDAMYDDAGDEPGAVDERDVVGDELEPAGFHYADPDFAYLRLRLEEDPSEANGDLRPFSWGFEFDTDGDASTYEVLVLASGIDQTVSVFTNDAVTLDNDPSDPADEPPVAVYDWADVGRIAAAGSDFGGDPDTYLDMAILWEDLVAAGMTPVTPIRTWAASSSQDNTLDGDFACHDGASGDPVLDDTVSDEEDVSPDSDGDGFSDAEEDDAGTDPNDPDDFPDGGPDPTGDTELQGGGGCSTSGGGASPLFALALLVAACLARQPGRRRQPSSGPSMRRPSSPIRSRGRSMPVDTATASPASRGRRTSRASGEKLSTAAARSPDFAVRSKA